MNMDNIEISKYFELTDEDKIYVNRYVLSLLDIEIDKLSKVVPKEDAFKILIRGLKEKKETFEVEEDYEHCEIISNAINILTKRYNAVS